MTSSNEQSNNNESGGDVHNFKILQNILCIKTDAERDRYILANKKQVIPVFRFVRKVFCNDKRIHLQDSEEHSFYLEFISHVSSAATSDQIDEDLCKVFGEDLSLVSILHPLVPQNLHSEYFKSLCLSSFANFSLSGDLAEKISKQPAFTEELAKLVDFFSNPKSTVTLKHSLAAYFTNLSHSQMVRLFLINENHLFTLLGVFEKEEDSRIRKSIVRTFRNCFFEEDLHSKLFSKENDQLIVKLVYSIAGPEEFDDEDNSSLPLDLQYLSLDKQREPDSEVRKLVLELLLQCCATRYGRVALRELNIYLILREYHKWETDRAVKLALENLIDILIKTEDEMENIDNLKEVKIPEDVVEKFVKEDEEAITGQE